MSKRTSFHVGIHVDLGHLKAGMLKHALHGNDVRMHLSPRQRFDGGINDIGTILAHFEDRSHRQTWAGMAVILDEDVWMVGLDHLCQLSEECRLSDAGHVLQTDFFCTGGNLLIGELAIVFQRVHGRGGNAERSLRSHASFLGPFDGRSNVADVVQAIEDTGNIRSLSVLHLVHHPANIVWHGIHTQCIQATIEHVGLDTHLVEGLAERPYGLVWILSSQQVHLLEGSSIGLHASKAAHFNDDRSDPRQLIFAWLELTGALPHVSIDETELNFLFHIYCFYLF